MNTAPIPASPDDHTPWQVGLPSESDIIPGIISRKGTPFRRSRRLLHTALALAVGVWAAGATAQAADSQQPGDSPAKQAAAPKADASSIGYADGKYILPPLPYAYDALEPLMDATTVRLHHDKHHAAYVAGANAAAQKLREIAEGKLEASQAAKWAQTLSFNAAGHNLHTVYWTNMSPAPQTAPQGALETAIDRTYGSTANLVRLFKAVALGIEGSGWAILGVDPASKELVLYGVEKHQNNEIPGIIPILACDVWEHAYYLKHQNNRAAYIDNFLKLVDWKNVENRYTAALGNN